MALIGRFHPLLIHFPIALVMVAVAAEGAFVVTHREAWRTVAISNVRAGSAFALISALAGWQFALAPGMDETPLLEWHRWAGTVGAALTLAAAVATWRATRASAGMWRIYRVALFGAAVVVGLAGHLGGLMVWGADFLRP